MTKPCKNTKKCKISGHNRQNGKSRANHMLGNGGLYTP